MNLSVVKMTDTSLKKKQTCRCLFSLFTMCGVVKMTATSIGEILLLLFVLARLMGGVAQLVEQ